MDEATIIVPEENQLFVVLGEPGEIEVPGEWRWVEVQGGLTMLLGSKQHTVGDTRKWQVFYGRWLANTVTIITAVVTSSSTTCTIINSSVLGNEVIFFLTGGVLGETLTVTIVMTDSFGNIKTDTISFHVVAP